tara:strand:+ start:172 stop:471 length:300 start_codon:yes stop_codon:yes gene_type:complete
MARTLGEQIIDDIFWIKYSPTIDSNKSWQQNINTFVASEWNSVQNEPQYSQFTDNEKEQIFSDAKNHLSVKLSVNNVDQDNTIDWTNFDNIIGYYSWII